MSLLTDALATRTVRPAIVGGVPTDTRERPGAESSGVARIRSADAPRAGSSDGGSPETERTIVGSPASPGRMSQPHPVDTWPPIDEALIGAWTPGELAEAFGK